MEEKNRNIQKNKDGSYPYFILSLVVLGFVIGISAFFWMGINRLDAQISRTESDIDGYSDQITKLKSSNEVVAYDIILSNRKQIEEDIRKTIVSKQIKEMISLSRRYKMVFEGFSYDGKSISTNGSYVAKDPNQDAVEGISNFIRDFRTAKIKSFQLSPITAVSGDSSSRSISVGLNILEY